jgi:hypothetical protein
MARLLRDAALDSGEELLTDAIAVERRGAKKTQPIVFAARDEGIDPRLYSMGGDVGSKSAQNTVPEHRGVALQFHDLWRYVPICAGSPSK